MFDPLLHWYTFYHMSAQGRAWSASTSVLYEQDLHCCIYMLLDPLSCFWPRSNNVDSDQMSRLIWIYSVWLCNKQDLRYTFCGIEFVKVTCWFAVLMKRGSSYVWNYHRVDSIYWFLIDWTFTNIQDGYRDDFYFKHHQILIPKFSCKCPVGKLKYLDNEKVSYFSLFEITECVSRLNM